MILSPKTFLKAVNLLLSRNPKYWTKKIFLDTSTSENVMTLFYTSYDLLGTYRDVGQ